MASGTLSVEISWNNGYYYQIDWSSTANIAGNYSDITCNHYIKCRAALSIGSNTGCYSQVNGGDTKTFTQPAINVTGSPRVAIGTTSHRVYHNGDGTKSVTLKGYVNSAFLQYPTISQSITLDTIARASSITSVTSSVAMTGSASCTVAINRKSSSFTHSVKFTFGGYSHTVTGATTSASYTIPASWNNAIPNSTSGTATVTVTTYSGSTQIGSSVSSTFTVTVPSSVVPSFTSLSTERIDGSVPSAWGVYVQGKSKCELTINGAVGSYSSTIKSYSITGSGIATSAWQGTTSFLNDTGTLTYTAKITDSRGRTATKTTSITVYAYTAPSATGTAYRANSSGATAPSSGTYIAITPTGAISSCDGHNGKQVQYRYKQIGGSYTSWTTATSGTKITVGSGNISTSYSYVVEIKCTDSFTTSSTYTINVGSAKTMMSWFGKNGFAIGKVAEQDNLFEVEQPAKFNNPVAIGSTMTVNGLNTENKLVILGNESDIYLGNTDTTAFINCTGPQEAKVRWSSSDIHTIYHTGNKPTASDVGAMPVVLVSTQGTETAADCAKRIYPTLPVGFTALWVNKQGALGTQFLVTKGAQLYGCMLSFGYSIDTMNVYKLSNGTWTITTLAKYIG